jgi:hypothetical protein
MADVLTTRIRVSSTNTHKVLISNDMTTGTDETAAVKLDKSAMAPVPSSIGIRKIQYNCNGVVVKLGWDATAKEYPVLLEGIGSIEFDPPLRALDLGGTGDLILSTVGATAADTYMLDLDLSLSN